MLVRLSNPGKTFVTHIVKNVLITEDVPLEEVAGPAPIVTQLLVWNNYVTKAASSWLTLRPYN